jgi:penicillin G amidase
MLLALSFVAGVVVLALIAATVFSVWSVRRAFPDYSGSASMPGLTGDVEIYRDANGIPHIYADTAEDLFRAQGFVHAQDRFWEMDFRRHVTSGRLSELFGADQVETDTFIRTLGWRSIAQQELPLLEPATRRYLHAYSAGVNGWLAEHSGGERGVAYTLLGLIGGDNSPERWTAADSLSWLKAMAWDLRGNLETELERALLAAELPVERVDELFPAYPYDLNPPIVADDYLAPGPPPDPVDADGEPLPAGAVSALAATASAIGSVGGALGVAGDGIGSNSWVVDGSRTTSGEPLLVNDPHLGPSMPSIWYQIGLHCRTITQECPFNVTGFSFSGLPGVVIGHNDQVGWGFTNLGADVTDLYLERVIGDRYLTADGMEDMTVRTETIRVAGGDDVTIRVRSTRHGPILSDHADSYARAGKSAPVAEDSPPRVTGYAVALRWTALDPGRTADALFALNRAEDWESFRAAAALFDVPSQNLVYADVEGNIGYQAPGKIPVRAAGDGRWPVPGWTDEYDWIGYIPFDALPSVFNPDEGYIVTANQPVTSPDYPFLLTEDFGYGYRAKRIHDLLEAGGPLDADAMAEIVMDSYNPMAEIMVPYLLDLEPLGDYYGDGIELLRDWDYHQTPDSAAAAYYNAVWRQLLRITFHDELPEDQWPSGGGRWFEIMRHLLEVPDDPFWNDVGTEDVIETRDDILRRAARAGRDDMTRRQGKNPEGWEWGRLHALELVEPSFGTSGVGLIEALFNRGPVEVGGGSDLVQATGWNAASGYQTNWVPSMRMILDFADLDQSRWIDLTGVSGHPFHEHYGDQTEMWRTGGLLPMRSDPASVESAAAHRFVLSPDDPRPVPGER